MNSQPLTDKDIGFIGVSEPIEKGPATIRGRAHPVMNNKAGFQIDACLAHSWMTRFKSRSDWLIALSDRHQFENPSKHLLNAKGVTERSKGRKKTYEEPQREYLFDQLNKHLEKALVDSCKLRRINLPKDTRHKEIGYLKSESRKCCYFQLCRTNTKVPGSKLRLATIFLREKSLNHEKRRYCSK